MVLSSYFEFLMHISMHMYLQQNTTSSWIKKLILNSLCAYNIIWICQFVNENTTSSRKTYVCISYISMSMRIFTTKLYRRVFIPFSLHVFSVAFYIIQFTSETTLKFFFNSPYFLEKLVAKGINVGWFYILCMIGSSIPLEENWCRMSFSLTS